MFKNINLQLFAENNEDGANLETDINNNESIDDGIDNSNVDENGDQQPEIEAIPADQSINKDNPANRAFAEMRRKNKELETQVSQQKQLDAQYVELGKKLGYTGITNAKDFAEAVARQETLNKYAETQDPNYLVEAITNSILPKINQVQQTSYVDNGLNQEIESFNKEFNSNLRSVEDIITLPNYEKIIGYMQDNNLSLSEAYTIANKDKVKAATRQAAINQVRGNSHITNNSNGGKVETGVVSSSEISNWKRWFPGKTDDQCRKEILANRKLMEG